MPQHLDVNVTAPDGRVLAGRTYGPTDGEPVLFVAGAGSGKTMRFGDDLLDSAGIRLLTMDRPGMGGSTVDPTRSLASTAEDYRAFVAGALERPAEGAPVVANSQGSAVGLRIAADGWASRLVLASPADEVAHPTIEAMLPAESTSLPRLAQRAPAEAAAILASFTAEAMEAMVVGGSDDADRGVYSEPGFQAMYRDALAEGFANGGRGYVQDTLLAMRPWDVEPTTITAPVTILFGARDAVHSPDLGATLAARIPGAERSIIEDAGGALLWTHAETVLAALRS